MFRQDERGPHPGVAWDDRQTPPRSPAGEVGVPWEVWMIAVLGASGFLGLHALRACARRERTRGIARRSTHWLRGAGVPVAYADLDQPEALRAALQGARVLVHAAAHYPRLSSHPADSVALAVRQSRAVAEAAASAGVERVVLLSSVATAAPNPDRPSDEGDRYATPPLGGTYHAVKWHIERVFEADPRFRTHTLCPGACVGPGDWRLGTQGALLGVARGRSVALPDGWVNPVDARDVGEAAARVAVHPDPPARLLLAAESVRAVDLLAQVQARTGASGALRVLPLDLAQRLADAEEARAEQTGRRPLLSREIVDLLAEGCPVDAGLAERALDLRWTPFSKSLDDFLAWTGGTAALEGA